MRLLVVAAIGLRPVPRIATAVAAAGVTEVKEEAALEAPLAAEAGQCVIE